MKNNRTCAYCGKPYYVCLSCISKHSYHNSFCSNDCYKRSLMTDGDFSPIVIDDTSTDVLMRGRLHDFGYVDIIGYSLELGKFDCSDGITRELDDFDLVQISRNEMKEICEKFEKMNENQKRTRKTTK